MYVSKASLDGQKLRNHASGNSGEKLFISLAADYADSHDTQFEVSSWLHFFSGFQSHTLKLKEEESLQPEWEILVFLLCICVHLCLPQKVGHSLAESSWRKWCLTMTQPSHALHSSSLQSLCVLLPLSTAFISTFYSFFFITLFFFHFMCFWLESQIFCPSPPDSS